MSQRRRIESMEQKTAHRVARSQQDRGVCMLITHYDAYYCGEGPRLPDPPCPPW